MQVSTTNYDKLPLKDLMSLQTKINQAIPAAKARERSELMDEMSKLAARRGFSVREVFGMNGHKRHHAKHRYVNPENRSETWSGMGRMPNWLADKIKKGAEKDKFKVA